MRSYFSRFLELESAEAEKLCRQAISNDQGKAAAERTLLSGRRWLVLEEILVDSLTKYGDRLVEELKSVDPEHSPVRASDFEAAKASLKSYRKRREELHAEQRNRPQLRYPQSHAPFRDGSLDRVESKALNDIDGVLIVFNSKRSFTKWAFGDLRKRIWSGGLVILGGIVGAALIPYLRGIVGL